MASADDQNSNADQHSDPAYSLVNDRLTGKSPRKQPVPYVEMFPDIKHLLPGTSFEQLEDPQTVEEIKKINEKKAKLQQHGDQLEQLLQAVRHGQTHCLPELVSMMTELANAADRDSIHMTAFIGPQGVGKSFVENLMTLLGVGVSHTGLGTKAVVHYELRKFRTETCTIEGSSVRYESIYTELQKLFSAMEDVENRTIKIQIHAPWVAFQADYLDVPGVPEKAERENRKKVVFDIIQSLAARKNVDFVIVGDATCDPDSVPDQILQDLRKLNIPQCNIIPVLNKVNVLLDNRNSAEQNCIRIKDWINWYGQEPYLFASSKETEFDTIHNLPPREQVERWERVVRDGDRHIQDYMSKEMNSYPPDRLGVACAVRRVTSKVTENIVNVIEKYQNALRNQTSKNRESNEERADEATLQDAFSQFISTFPRVLDDLAHKRYGLAMKVDEEGGGEFFETQEMTDKRNQKFLSVFKIYGTQLPTLKEDFLCRNVVTGILDDGGSDYRFGIEIMKYDFVNSKTEVLQRFKEFNDWDLHNMIPVDHRTDIKFFHNAIPTAVSRVAKYTQITNYLNYVIARQACNLRRVYQAAFWHFVQNYPKNSPMGMLLHGYHFRVRLMEMFDQHLMKNIKESQAHMEIVYGETIDASSDVTLPQIYAKPLGLMFNDLKDETEVDLTKYPQVKPLRTHPDLDNEGPEWRGTWNYMRKAIKAHYSLNIMKATEIFEHHFEYKWLRMLDHDKQNWLKDVEKIGRQNVVQAFQLDATIKASTALEESIRSFNDTVARAMASVSNVKDDLIRVLSTFNPFHKYTFDDDLHDLFADGN